MKPVSIAAYSLVLILICYLTLQIVANALTGKALYMPSISNPFSNKPGSTVSNISACSDKPMIQDLSKAKSTYLRRLAEYQVACKSYVTSHLMLFTDMPKDSKEAKEKAQKLSEELKEFAYYNITPVVIVEPVTSWGLVDFTEFKSGFYDKWISDYFTSIKSSGVSVEQMGIWVPFPEANLPYWNHSNASPEDFSAIVNKYLTIANKVFPKLQGSVLLNSATYESDDFDWANGTYSSLVPYVKSLDKSLIQSFGLQGFPWMPPANGDGAGIFDAAEFLNYRLAKEAADTLNTKNIWFNTGTFQAKYVGDTERQTYVSPSQRADILAGILNQLRTLKQQGYNVSVNLFAEDKSGTSEATNWSYFTSDTVTTSENSPVFVNFAKNLSTENIPLRLYDTE